MNQWPVERLAGLIGRDMREAISKFIHGLFWVMVVLAFFATALWLGTKDGLAGVVFLFVARCWAYFF